MTQKIHGIGIIYGSIQNPTEKPTFMAQYKTLQKNQLSLD
jgi:hypothetical protein